MSTAKNQETRQRFRVIGPGRAGRSMADALSRSGWNCVAILGRADDITHAATDTDLLILAVPDGEIAKVANSVMPADRTVICHLAGSRTLADLGGHLLVGSIHPLMSLPDPMVGSERLRDSCTFAISGSPLMASVVEDLGGTAIRVDDANRAHYHATATVAANHMVALYGQVERLAAQIGLPIEAFQRLMATSLANAKQAGAKAALTGPAARADWDTIESHISAIPNFEAATYVAMAKASATLAGQQWPSNLGEPQTTKVETPVTAKNSGSASNRALDSSSELDGTSELIEQISTIPELRLKLDAARAAGKSVGFVPTMGFLHDGHGSLIRAAAKANDIVVVSIFVNPLQFAANEDLSDYPRDLARDTILAQENGADLLFTPSGDEMYPHGKVLTSVSVDEISNLWEGASRPTHFSGVATVVAKLFSIVGTCRAYFGEKDFQQLAVIRRMTSDLSIPVEVVGCPIIRETDGLAMSSRNTFLEGETRAAATILRQALDVGLALIADGERDPLEVESVMTDLVNSESLAELDYVAAVDGATLARKQRLEGEIRLLIAVKVGRPRLIDNDGLALDY